jgi:hypothetical protein
LGTDFLRAPTEAKYEKIIQIKLNQPLLSQICTELSPIGRVNEVIARSTGVSARQVSKIETY